MNELEIMKESSITSNYLFANQFLTNYIYMIDLRDGKVAKRWDLGELIAIEKENV